MLNTLYATEVELLDASGSQVILIDSVVIEPSWLDLLQREFSVRNITLYNPKVNLVFKNNGALNLTEALVSVNEEPDSVKISQDSESKWAFRSATIHVIGGSLFTSNLGESPSLVSLGKIFDYSNSSFEEINVEARIDWMEPTRVIDVVHFSGSVDQGKLKLDGGQSQVLLDDDRLTVNDFAFVLGKSSLALRGWVEHSARLGTADWEDMPFELEIVPRVVDFEELKVIFPLIPVGDTASLSGHIRGPLSNVTLTSLRVSANDAALELNGTIAGLLSDAFFDVSVTSTPLAPDQLQRWLPDLPVSQTLTMERLEINSRIAGSLSSDSRIVKLDAEGNAEIRSSRGTLSASFELDGPLDDSLHFDVRFSTSGVDPSFWTGKSNLPGTLNGNMRLIGIGLSPERTSATFSAEFTDFRLADLFVPEVRFNAQLDTLRFRASLNAIQLEGRLDAELSGRYENSQPTFSLDLASSEFDIGNLLSKNDLTTSLNLHSNLSGSGTSFDTFNGTFTVAVDSSGVTSKENTSLILPHKMSFFLRKQNNSVPRLSIRGDILDLSVRKNVPFDILAMLGNE